MPYTVAFVGCPNVGKSTVFNALTGLRQHTGNWTGKTVDPARGRWTLEGETWEAVDLPGVYSLEGGTPEERVAAEYLKTHRLDAVVVVLDATALERSLALALELRVRHPHLVLCLNLTDEADRLGLVPGTEVRCLRRLPLGDPAVYRWRDIDVALRNRDASRIEVISKK